MNDEFDAGDAESDESRERPEKELFFGLDREALLHFYLQCMHCEGKLCEGCDGEHPTCADLVLFYWQENIN